MDPKRKNLLIVTCGFPPSGGMGIHRITKFAKYLSRRNWNIYVVTTNPTKYGRKNYSLLNDIPKAIKVFRTNDLCTSKKYSKFSRIRFLFDYYFKWYPKALITGRNLIKEYKIDLIYISFPWASHIVIGFILSLITSRCLIIDYRDYWDKRFFSLTYLLDCLERKIIKQSNHVIFNNFHTSEIYKDKYKTVLGNKYSIIENGYDIEDILCAPNGTHCFFNIVYAGNLYNKKVQRPFLNVIKQLAEKGGIDEKDFRITFVGYGNNIDKEYIHANRIESFFKFVSDVTHAESIRIQMMSNLLLLFANFEPSETRWRTPGKFFEYLGTGKPILLLAPRKSAMADYLQWTKSGVLVDPADIKGVKNAITGFYNDWKNGKIFSMSRNPLLPRDNFNIENLTNKLEGVFCDVIK